MMLFVNILDRYTTTVQAYIKSFLNESGFLQQRALYHHGFINIKGHVEKIVQSGKLLRSTLLLLTVESLQQKKWSSAIPAAAALEVFHNATLIVDDWQDKDTLRRGRQAVWTLEDVGPEQAINIAFFLVSLSSDMLLGLSDRSFSSEIKLRVQSLFEQTKMSVIQGQQKDIAFEKKVIVSIDEYMDMIWLKTGIFIQAAIVMGALLGNADKQTLTKLSHVGKIMGILFQMQDDYLGVYGKRSKTGKPAEDIFHKKKSLPVILAFEHASFQDREKLLKIYSKRKKTLSAAEVTRIEKIFLKLDIQKKVRERVEKTYKELINLLSEIHLSRKDDFLFLADLLAHREK